MSEQRVVIADANLSSRKSLKALLGQAGFMVMGEAEDGLRALKLIRNRQPDLVIMDARLAIEDNGRAACIVQEEGLAPLILLTGPDQLNLRGGNSIIRDFAYVIKPVTEDNLMPVIDLVTRHYRKIRELEDEILKLKATLETRRLVEKAKGILMHTMSLTEEEAFKRIQQQSMNKRVSMKSVARAIILTEELKV